jgi:hypothetical protein
MLQEMKSWMQRNIMGVFFLNLLIWCTAVLPVVADAQVSTKLKIIVKAGEGATNNIMQRINRELAVQVVGENNKPMAGTKVLFTLPNEGAGGAFADSAKTFTVLTDQRGLATASFVPNKIVGSFEIYVSASYQDQFVTAAIPETNASTDANSGKGAAHKKTSRVLIGTIAAAAAGAVAMGILVSKKGGGDEGLQPKATIGVGSSVPVLGAP